MDTIAHWFHIISGILYCISPIMMGVACLCWLTLYSKTNKYQSKIEMHYYILQHQIDLLLTHYTIDKRDIELIERLKKMYE